MKSNIKKCELCAAQLIKKPNKSYAEFAMKRFCADCHKKNRAKIFMGAL